MDEQAVGIIGSPSSTSAVRLDLTGEATHLPLLGSMVWLEQEMGERTEVGIGTVAEVTTVNQWHENISMRGVIAVHGELLGLSGRADVKGADVSIQAVYERCSSEYRPTGAALSMSPATGGKVHRVTDAVLADLTSSATGKFYLGDIYRMPGVRLPLNPSDFSGARGAFHAGVFGPSGVGKSVFTLYYLAGQLRHEDLAIFIVDPQGQFTIERGEELPFSFQGLARGMGRQVIARDLATEIRLPQNRYLFTELLARTPFFKNGLTVRYAAALDSMIQVVEEALETTKAWPDLPLDDLLDALLDRLREATVEGHIYKDLKRDKNGDFKPEGAGYQLLVAIDEALNDKSSIRRRRLVRSLQPVASLFSDEGPGDRQRMKMEALLHQAFERVPGRPRPVIILNLAFSDSDTDDEDEVEIMRALNAESTKARILRTLFDDVQQIAGRDYRKRGSQLLNVLVVFDEAWRYAPRSSADDEIKELSSNLAEYARVTRKYGLGWMYVLQNPHELHPAVWDQLKSGFRAFGYGLTGADLAMIRDQVDSADSIALYRSFAQPSDMNRQYPFMLVGAISPLSFTMAPLFTSVYTDFAEWSEKNADWLPENARRGGLSTEVTTPNRTSRQSAEPDFI